MLKPQGTVGPYTLKTLLATGGQSQVWEAESDQGTVALKVARTERHRACIRREVHVLSIGQHPCLPRLVDHDPKLNWLSQDLILGSPIDQWAQAHDFKDLLAVARQLLDVLDFLHGHGIVHGDLKPRNILVDADGRPTLCDFGVADTPEESVEGFSGTLGFVAPESLQGKKRVIPDADLYGLAALLFSCIAGRPPFTAEDPAALTYLPMVTLPPPLSSLVPEVPKGLDEMIATMLCRSPTRRLATTDDVRDALDAIDWSEPSEPLFGMQELRDTLRKAIIGAADGEPRVVVVYGPPGCGRRSLLTEAMKQAQREGLDVYQGSDMRQLFDRIRLDGKPVAALIRGASNNARKLASHALQQGLPCLLLAYADRPVPALVKAGAIQSTPAPLALVDVRRMIRYHEADEGQAETWWRASQGLPASVHGYIRHWHRKRTNGVPVLRLLSQEGRQILTALGHRSPIDVTTLAHSLGLSEHLLLDHCEALFAEGLAAPTENGMQIRLGEPTP